MSASSTNNGEATVPVAGSDEIQSAHYHVQSGLAGYGPDCDENTATFENLSEALDYARDEFLVYIDMLDGDMRQLASQGDYEESWRTFEFIERLEFLRANLDPRRANAPLYRDDAAAYAALQESQADEFPHDVSHNSRLYLWTCTEAECIDAARCG